MRLQNFLKNWEIRCKTHMNFGKNLIKDGLFDELVEKTSFLNHDCNITSFCSFSSYSKKTIR